MDIDLDTIAGCIEESELPVALQIVEEAALAEVACAVLGEMATSVEAALLVRKHCILIDIAVHIREAS
jgi:hypothetical protein